MVGSSFGKHFETNYAVNPGKVAKLLLRMALTHVLITEKKHEVCRNLTSSVFA